MRAIVFALPCVAIGLLVALRNRVVVTVAPTEHGDVVEIARHTRRWRMVGLLIGAVAALVLLDAGQRLDALGRVSALAPAALGASVLIGTIAGELTARPAVGIRRTAAVETRTVKAVLPKVLSTVLAVASALLVAALAIGAAWGSADDMGRPGRIFTQTCTVLDPDLGPVLMSSGRGPWPGSFYAVPLAAALLVLAALITVALRVIVSRPRPGVDSHDLDTMLRRWSVGNVLTAATVTVLATLGPVALFIASALSGGTCPLGVGESVVLWAAWVIAPLATGGAFSMLAWLALTPSIRVDDLPRPLTGDAAPLGAPVR